MKILRNCVPLPFLLIFFSALPMTAQTCQVVVKVNEGAGTLRSVAYHDGYALAVGNNGLALLSTDGRIWTNLNSGTNDDFVDVVWAGDRFALLANRPGVTTLWTWDTINGLMALPDLINTISGKTGHALGWVAPNLIIAYMDNLFDSGRIRTTQDFVTLSQTAIDRSTHCGEVRDIDTVNGVTVMGVQCIDSNGFISSAGVYVSSDGSSFPWVGFPPFESLGPGGMGTDGNIIFANASKWDPKSSSWLSYFYHSPMAGTGFTEYPADGSLRTQMRDANWIAPYFIGVGPAGLIIKSLDGLDWESFPSPHTGFMRKVIPFEEGFFLAVGDNATIILGATEAYLSILETWPETSNCSDLILNLDNCLLE